MMMAIFAIVSLMFVSALAVDAGHLYHSRQALQKAADAGSLAALAHTIRVGLKTLNTGLPAGKSLCDVLTERANEVAVANLSREGLAPDVTHPIRVNPGPCTMLQVNPDADTVLRFTVTVDRPIDFLIMNLIPFEMLGLSSQGTNKLLAASATVQRRRANIALMLDLSKSMECPATGPCTCLTPARTGPCPRPWKVEKLLDAVTTFAKMFDYNNDNLAIVPFNIGAQDYSLEDLVNSVRADPRFSGILHDKGSWEDSDIDLVGAYLRNNAGPSNNTNVCDGLLRAYARMQRSAHGKEASYLYFGDGAPTAFRGIFSAPKPGLDPWNPDSLGNYDYSFHSIDWYDPYSHRTGPSLLAKSGTYRPDFSNMSMADPPLLLPACSPRTTPVLANNSAAVKTAAANAAFGPCLNNFALSEPTDSGGARVSGGGAKPDDLAFADFEKLEYLCAVVYSDMIRRNRGTVYTIGLGEPAASSPSDFFQTIGDPESRKDYFMARVANDYNTAVLAGAHQPELNYTNYTPYADWEAASSPRQGNYLATTDIGTLTALFRKIGIKILLTLIQ